MYCLCIVIITSFLVVTEILLFHSGSTQTTLMSNMITHTSIVTNLMPDNIQTLSNVKNIQHWNTPLDAKDYYNGNYSKSLNWSKINYHLSNKIACFAGQAKDVAKTIIPLLTRIEWLAENVFDTVIVVIMESNSKDKTFDILARWKKKHLHQKNSKLKIYLLPHSLVMNVIEKYVYILANKKYIYDKYYNQAENKKQIRSYSKVIPRLPRYVVYRNFILQLIKHLNVYQYESKIDYLMLIDWDTAGIDVKSMLNEMIVGMIYQNYSVLCVNGRTNTSNGENDYYDTFGLVMKNAQAFNDFVNRSKIAYHYTNRYRFQSVISCFGGLAIYNFQNIVNNNIANQCQYFLLEYSPQNKHKFSSVLSIKEQYLLFQQLYNDSNISIDYSYNYSYSSTVYSNQTRVNQMKYEISNWAAKDQFPKSVMSRFNFDNKFDTHNLRTVKQNNNMGAIKIGKSFGSQRRRLSYKTISKHGKKDEQLSVYMRDYKGRENTPFSACEHVTFHYCLTHFAGLKIGLARDTWFIYPTQKRNVHKRQKRHL